MPFCKTNIPKDQLLQSNADKKNARAVFFEKVLTILVFALGGLAVIEKVYAVEHLNTGVLQQESLQALQSSARAGQMFVHSSGNLYTPAVHLGSEADIDISAMLASVTLVQRFRNDSDDWVEGVYVFPLAEKSAVNYMQLKTADRIIRAEIKEKQVAKKIYQQAKTAGKKAALTEQQRPNLFTQSVANIAPGEEVEVTLRFLQPVIYNAGEFSLRFPMTLTPRYIPGVPKLHAAQYRSAASHSSFSVVTGGLGWAVPTDQVPDADRITPFVMPPVTQLHSSLLPVNPMSLSVSLKAGLPLAGIDSIYHQVVISKEQEVHNIKLTEGVVAMDRDFVLSWRPAVGQSPAAALFTETLEGDDYVSLMLLPPQAEVAEYQESEQQDPAEGFQGLLPRELVFIIDTSGSMGGVSITQAKKSLQLALSRMKAQDRFNVIEFNSTHRSLFPRAQQASVENITQAQMFVRQLQARGGTEMAPALLAALSDEAVQGYLKQVVFITDGSVGNEAALFALIHEHLGGARLFTVGIGSAPNSYFMRKAAQFGRGTYTFIGRNNEVINKMGDLFRKLESPVLGNIDIQWPDGVEVEMWPQRLPDLYSGEPLIVNAKISHGSGTGLQPTGAVVISGTLGGELWESELALSSNSQNSGIATQWAREKISALLDQKIAGRDPQQVREDVLKVALKHQLLSPYTSFVAVAQTISRAPELPLQRKPIANLLPYGQKASPIMYPATATSAPLNLVIGAVSLLLALLLSGAHYWRQRA